MHRQRHATSATSRRARPSPGILAAVGALSSVLCICVGPTLFAAQVSASPAPSTAVDRDAEALFAQLDRLLAEKRTNEADSVYAQLLQSRTDAVTAGLQLASANGTSSELTLSYLCSLASQGVPAELSASVLGHVLSSPSTSDWTKRHCIVRLGDRVDASFREPFLRFAADPDRDLNLRIAALKTATSRWPIESHATLVQLLQSNQDGIIHHKAQQYLAPSGHPDALSLIEQFVLNRDPATAGAALSKEYGLLILRFRLGEEVIPLLASILRDESWPGEIQDRAIDLLAHSDLQGGRAVLMETRVHAGAGLKARIDSALTGRE